MFENATNNQINGGTFINVNRGSTEGFEFLQKATAPNAFHNAAERRSSPRCPPNIYTTVIARIMNWIRSSYIDVRDVNAVIMWIYGKSGAGKSAIAQTISDCCDLQHLLLASFFFSRLDPSRNNPKSLITTIAYQIVKNIPDARPRISAAMENDPLVTSCSLESQLLSLVVEPLRQLIESGYFAQPSSRRLIIIDGLDECSDHNAQCDVIQTISRSFQQHKLPFLFIITSQQEPQIFQAFDSKSGLELFSLIPLLPECYETRALDGTFEVIENMLRDDIKPTETFASGNITYGVDFTRKFIPAKPDSGFDFGQTRYYLGKNTNNSSKEMKVLFFGEICPNSQGTKLSAKGNHYDGREGKPITDKSIVKDVLVLRAPTCGTDALTEAFRKQVAVLQQIVTAETNDLSLIPPNSCITDFFKSSTTDSGTFIKIVLPRKYALPSDLRDVKANYRRNNLPTNNGEHGQPETGGPNVPVVERGALYSPDLLPDHRGAYFQQKNAKLVQQDIWDDDNNLITPWETYDKLRVGTIVVVDSTLICWHIPNVDGPPKKTYQIRGDYIRILSESDQEIEL